MADPKESFKQLINARQKRRHLSVMPLPHVDTPAIKPVYTVFDYDATHLQECKDIDGMACKDFHKNGHMTWINVDGLDKKEVEQLCDHYEVHALVVEDILSLNERAKMEESSNVIFCVLPMLYFNEKEICIDKEQVSIVLGKDFLLSFQEEADRDVFDPVRKHLHDDQSKLRTQSSDYLCYSLLDLIVDSYFVILEKLGAHIEDLEDELLESQTEQSLGKISMLRREVMTVHRVILPVRELVAAFVRSDSDLLEERHEKYFRDVLDHMIQANDYADNHRDMLMNLQDLYMNQINLKMNEVMKILTIVATLIAPATLISGIFGMNFNVFPLLHQKYGFYISVAAMLIIPMFMLMYFKRKKWF